MSLQVEAALIAAGVGVLTVVTTAFTQYLGHRATSKQLDRTLADQRLRTLNERFATAAGQLGSDKPAAVRLAGVYAMAGLAEDWEENRQTCVDVLCGYLHLPHDPDPGDNADPGERATYLADWEVRRTVIRVITADLQAGAARQRIGQRCQRAVVSPDSGHRHPPLRVRLGTRRPGGQRPAGGQLDLLW